MSLWIAASGILPLYAEETDAPAETTAEIEEISPSAEPEAIKETYTYTIDGLGKVTSATVERLGASASLYHYTAKGEDALQSVYALTVDPARGGIVRGVNLGDRLGSRVSVTTLSGSAPKDEILLGAVNGDFFSLQTGVPLGVYISDGRYISSSDGNMAIGFDDDGNAFFGKVEDKITVEYRDETYEIEYMNKYPTIYGVYLLTEDYAPTTRLASDVAATEYVLDMNSSIDAGKRVRGKVIEVRKGAYDNEIPAGCAVLVVPDAFDGKAAFAGLEKGDRVYIEIEVDRKFRDAVSAIGGGSVILEDGEIAAGIADEDLETKRHPRTALGVTEAGEIMLFAADGRQTDLATGLTMTELASAMRDLGCTDAINLDGGGSTVMVRFDGEDGEIVNSPSEKPERRVPNALAAYEDKNAQREFRTLAFAAPESVLLTGATLPLALTLYDTDGDELDHDFDEENTTVTLDAEFGSVAFADGEILFTAGEADGIGKLRIETKYKRETLTLDIFLTVTNTIDSFTVSETVLMAPLDGEIALRASVLKDGKSVYFGDQLGVMCEHKDVEGFVKGDTVYISLRDEAIPKTEEPPVPETTEPPAEADEPAEDGGETAENEPLEESPAAAGAPSGGSATPIEPEGVHGRVAVYLREHTIVLPAFFDNNLSLDLALLFGEEMTAEPEGYTVTYREDVGVIYGGAYLLQNAPAEAEAAQPKTPFTMRVQSDKIVTSGLSGQRIWMWVDGLDGESHPHMILSVTDEDGKVHEEILYYDKFYDFLDYNGRALLTLTIEQEHAGVATLVSPLAYTAATEEQTVSFGPVLLGEEFAINLYADMERHWASYYVNALSYMGVVGGSEDIKGDLVYIPDDGLSREQFAKILVNYLQIDPEAYSDTVLNFADMESIALWAVPYVRAAVGAGLMRGRSTPQDTVEFAPRDGITRQEAIYVLGGLLESGEGADLTFADSDKIAPWAKENFSRALAAGLVSGYDDDTVRPEGRITRAEAATIVVRLTELPK